MIAVPSKTVDQDNVSEVLDLISDYLSGLGLTETDYVSNGVRSRLWSMGEEDSPLELLLCGHADVVDAESDQFVPVSKDGKIYGRGAGDMKGHNAAMVVALREYLKKGENGKVGLFISGDEEVGGFNGARYALEQGLKCNLVFIPDGSFDFDIVESQKAPHHFHIKAKGVGGHASRAFEIDNPVNRIINVYTAMREKYSVATRDDNWHSTFELTTIKTGNNSENSIPSDVDAWFSWRWPLEDFGFEEGVEDLLLLCKQNNCELVVEGEGKGHGMGEGCLTQREDSAVVMWKEIIEGVIGKEVGYANMHGATDGRHFYKYGSKVITTSAISGNHHAKEGEWVDIKSLEQLSQAIVLFLNSYLD